MGHRLDIIVMQQFAYTRYIFLFMFVPNSYLLNLNILNHSTYKIVKYFMNL